VATRVVHLKREYYDVRIDRATEWGNPYDWREGTKARYRVADRDEAIAQYRGHVLARPGLVAALPGLRDKTLGCWCAPPGGLTAADTPYVCHGQVLAELADAGGEG
jgi:Domain of unknown function (DUF4326)